MILLCLSTTCLVLILILLRRIQRTASYWKKTGIPYESYTSYLHCLLFRQSREDYFDLLVDYSKKYGHVYGTYRGLVPMLRVSTTDGVKDALLRSFSDAHGRGFQASTGSPLWDNNILALDYTKWKAVRRLTGTVLTASKLKQMKNKIERVAKRLTGKLEKLAKTNSEIDVASYAQGVIMDAVAAITFSLEVDALEDPNNIFIKTCNGLFSASLGLKLLFSFPGVLKYLPYVQFPNREVTEFFSGFTKTLLKQRRKPDYKHDDLDALDAWLETQKTNLELTDDMLVSQMFIFFLLGYETSSYTLTFAMYLLATHPEKQEEVYQNIMENASDPNNITYEELSKMKHLEACIFETLRLYPTDSILERITVAPCNIGGVPLDEGVYIQVPVSAIHNDPERFHEPLQFRPERFVNGSNNIQEVLSFGDGPKNCVGQRMAVVQLMIVLSAILRSVRLEPAAVDDAYDQSLEYQPKVERLPGQIFLPFAKTALRVKVAPRK